MQKYSLYAEDCLQGLKNRVESDSISLICTSPPYNANIKYGTYCDNKHKSEYCNWLHSIFAECYRVLSPDGSFFLNINSKPSQQALQFEVINSCLSLGFNLQNTIIWVKSIYINNRTYGHVKPINSNYYINSGWEFILHFTKADRVTIDKLGNGVPYSDKSNIKRWKNKGDLRDRGNVWYIPYDTVQGKKDHPAAFPLELPKRCMNLHGLDRISTILDPFCGSGMVGVAALDQDKSFIGFDIDPAYIQLTVDKLQARATSSLANKGVRDGSEK